MLQRGVNRFAKTCVWKELTSWPIWYENRTEHVYKYISGLRVSAPWLLLLMPDLLAIGIAICLSLSRNIR